MKNNNKSLTYISYAAAALLLLVVCGYALAVHRALSKPVEVTAHSSKPLNHHRFEEAEAKLVNLLKEKDPKASFDYLRGAIKKDTSLARECHPLLHHLGHAAYDKYKDFNKTISYQDGLCNSGYTHGTIEAYFMDAKDIQAALRTTCLEDSNPVSFQQWQCYHGVGHGVMYYTNKDLSQSLSLCQSLPTDFARGSCVNGVFMERFIVVGHSGTLLGSKANITKALCEQQAEANKTDCYIYAPTAYLERHSNDYGGAFKDCKQAEKAYVNTCIEGVGSQTMKENVTRPEVAIAVCQKLSQEDTQYCVQGAIGLLINHNASTGPVEPLCNTAFARYPDICTQSIKAWNDHYFPATGT